MSAALAPSWPHAAQPPRATDDLEEIDEGDLWEDSGDVVARALADSGGDSGPAPAAAPGMQSRMVLGLITHVFSQLHGHTSGPSGLQAD